MIAPDKRVHFFVWLLITIAALFFFFYITDCAYFWIIANVIALLLAIGKEIFDCYKMKPTGIKRLDAILKKFGFIGN